MCMMWCAFVATWYMLRTIHWCAFVVIWCAFCDYNVVCFVMVFIIVVYGMYITTRPFIWCVFAIISCAFVTMWYDIIMYCEFFIRPSELPRQSREN